MKSKLTILFLFLIFGELHAQSVILKGSVKDEKGSPVPFTSVYIKNTTTGTSANSEGQYFLNLKPGEYDLIFKAIGFSTQQVKLNLRENKTFDVILKAEAYALKDVVIKAKGEDPAYAIIRKAIAKRKTHLKEIQSFTCEVYIKNLQRLLKAPKRFLGKDIDAIGKDIGLDSSRQGIVYLSESESKLSFIQPNQFKEEMISSKVSGSSRSISFNRATELNLNLYENLNSWEGLSNLPVVSPIAENALSHYNYKLMGSTFENGIEINKIKVIPKRKADALYSGEIYIIEDSWRIHSANLYLTKDANINFADTVQIHQNFFPVNNVWLPSSVRFDFTGGLFGFKIGGYAIAVYRNYHLDLQFKKNEFKEVMRITRDVGKKDTLYWQQARPLPLTEEEQNDYVKKQVLAAKKESKHYRDSVDKKSNRFRLAGFLFTKGYNHYNRTTKELLRFDPVLSSAFYNTVEGAGFDYGVSYSRQIDSNTHRYLNISAKARYGFSNQLFNPSASATVPIKQASLGVNVGSDMLDLNSQSPIPSLSNSINSLFYERNYLKLYQKKFISLSLSQRVAGAVRGTIGAEWAERKWLPNATLYTRRDLEGEHLTSNNPFKPDADIPLFERNQSFTLSGSLSYNFSKRYVTYPTGKYFLPSKYPTVMLRYTAGIGCIFGSDVNYQRISTSVSKSDIRFGRLGKTSFMAEGGTFLSAESLYFTDFKHFRGNEMLSFKSQLNSYLFLDYYLSATTKSYLEGHFNHNFSGLILNKIPLIRKLKLQEIVGANYLSTTGNQYVEAYSGIQYLNFKFLYGFSWQQGVETNSELRLALSL